MPRPGCWNNWSAATTIIRAPVQSVTKRALHIVPSEDIEAELERAREQPYELRGDCSYPDSHIDSHVRGPKDNGRWVCSICHPNQPTEGEA